MDVVYQILLGLVAGVLGGWLGIGGGIVMVPVLVWAFQMDGKRAIGTSLAVIVPIALAAVARHHFFDRVDWRVALPMAVGGLVGGVIGAWVLEKTPVDLAKRTLAIFMVYSAVRLWLTTLPAR